jgi:transposase-like protein
MDEHTRKGGPLPERRTGALGALIHDAVRRVIWKTLRTTNVIERLHEEFRRRVRTQGSLPTEDAAVVLLFGLVVSGQIRLRHLDGWGQIPAVLKQRRTAA